MPDIGDGGKQFGSKLLNVVIESLFSPAARMDQADRLALSSAAVIRITDPNGCDAGELNLESHCFPDKAYVTVQKHGESATF